MSDASDFKDALPASHYATVRRGALLAVPGALVAALVGALLLAGGTPQASPGGAPDPAVMVRMRYYNQALGVDCTYCHVPERYEIDTPRKRTAKWMQQHLVDGLVTREEQKRIDCHTCHDGRARFLPSSP